MTEKKTLIEKYQVGLIYELAAERGNPSSLGGPQVERWRVRVATPGPDLGEVQFDLPPEAGRVLNAVMLDSNVDLMVYLTVEAVPKP